MKRLLICAALLLAPALPANADEVTDTLESAIDAYESGDVKYALEELAFAQQLLQQMKADDLISFLPPAPDGWTREVNQNMNAGLAMMGGGVGAEAEYSGDGERFTIKMMADNPMVAAMSGMFGNAAIMAARGTLVRIGREKFVDQPNGELAGMINGRVFVQAEGADTELMIEFLELIDFRELGVFGL